MVCVCAHGSHRCAGCESMPMALNAVLGVLKHLRSKHEQSWWGMTFLFQARPSFCFAELCARFHYPLCFCLSFPSPASLPVTPPLLLARPALRRPPPPLETTPQAAHFPGLTRTPPSLTRTHPSLTRTLRGTTTAGVGTTTIPTGRQGGSLRTSLCRATPTGSASVGPTVVWGAVSGTRRTRGGGMGERRVTCTTRGAGEAVGGMRGRGRGGEGTRTGSRKTVDFTRRDTMGVMEGLGIAEVRCPPLPLAPHPMAIPPSLPPCPL